MKSIRNIDDYKTKTYTQVRTALDAEYVGVTPLQALSRFNRCKPTQSELFTDYVKRLKLLAIAATRQDDQSMLAHIAQHYPSSEIAKECMKTDMTVKNILAYAINEALNEKEHQPEVCKSDLNRIYHERASNNRRQIMNRYNPVQRGGKVQMSRPRNNSEPTQTKCSKCDRTHAQCKLFNHYARCCRNAKTANEIGPPIFKQTASNNTNRQLGAKPKPKSFIGKIESDTSDEEVFFIKQNRYRRIYSSINHVDESDFPTIDLELQSSVTTFVIDTGAGSNLISVESYNKMIDKPKLTPTSKRMYGFNSDEQIPILGTFETSITINNITKPTMFYVINNKLSSENLLGIKTLREFKIVEIMNHVATFTHCIKTKFRKLFEDRIGRMLGVKVNIATDPTHRPSQQPHYQVPYHMIPGTKAKLNELINQEIIEKVDETAKVTWISPMLPVEKNKSTKPKGKSNQQRQLTEQAHIRITSDNKKLNKAIVRRPRPMPSLQTLTYDLNGKKWFSKVDIRDAFNQLELDEQS